MLMDEPGHCDWEIVDLVNSYQIGQLYTLPTFHATKLDYVPVLLRYINTELEANEGVIPPQLVREGRYPKIRQMRDVHQFDVGTHLAACHAFAIRDIPSLIASTYELQHASSWLRLNEETSFPREGMSAAAVLHDAFKAFRPRRVLPSKVGSAQRLKWNLPSGKFDSSLVSLESEVEIACRLLPWFVVDDHLRKSVADVLRIGDSIGTTLYKSLRMETHIREELFREFVTNTANEAFSSQGYSLGLCDWLSKGWALHVLTTRKGCKVTLLDAGKHFLRVLNSELARITKSPEV
jgi:hypothetical protein